MKKIFAILIGMVFLTTIRCGSEGSPGESGEKKVTISLRSVEKNGEIGLDMRDSNGDAAFNTLETTVHRGTKILWKLDNSSGIKKIIDIYTSLPEGKRNVFKRHPKKQLFGPGYKLKVSDDVAVTNVDEKGEKYFIEYITLDKDTVKIDPYIRVPPIN